MKILNEAVLRHWRRVADPADVLAGQGAHPDPGVPPRRCRSLPSLSLMAWLRRSPRLGLCGWAVWLSWFRECVRAGVACVWGSFRLCVQVCVYGTRLVSA